MRKINKTRLSGFLAVCFVACAFLSCHTVDEPVLGEDITDVDGNVYRTVTLGKQTWMIENLRTTRYKDGTVIPQIEDTLAWSKDKSGAYCLYKDSVKEASASMGALYNWHAVNSGKLAPEGWHVPTTSEWTTLMKTVAAYNYLSGSLSKTLAADSLWLVSTVSGSIGQNLKKNNASHFNAIPSGIRPNIKIIYQGYKKQAAYWTNEKKDSADAWSYRLYYNDAGCAKASVKFNNGFSVRCVKDSL